MLHYPCQWLFLKQPEPQAFALWMSEQLNLSDHNLGKRSWNSSNRVRSWQQQYPPVSEDCKHWWCISPARLFPLSHNFCSSQMVSPYSTSGSVLVALGLPMPAGQGRRRRRKVSYQIINRACVWFYKIWIQPWTNCCMKTCRIIKCCKAVKLALLLQNPATCPF